MYTYPVRTNNGTPLLVSTIVEVAINSPGSKAKPAFLKSRFHLFASKVAQITPGLTTIRFGPGQFFKGLSQFVVIVLDVLQSSSVVLPGRVVSGNGDFGIATRDGTTIVYVFLQNGMWGGRAIVKGTSRIGREFTLNAIEST